MTDMQVAQWLWNEIGQYPGWQQRKWQRSSKAERMFIRSAGAHYRHGNIVGARNDIRQALKMWEFAKLVQDERKQRR